MPEADPDDRLPEFSGTAVTAGGDLWQLGKHRVLCGNSLVTDSYEQLMQGERADLLICDPPYNVEIDGHASGNGSIHHREFAMASGEMSSAEFTDFLRKAMVTARNNSQAGSLAYYFMDWRHMREILSAGRDVYAQLLNLCVWAKSNGGMGSFYRSAHELVFLFKNGTGSHRNNIQLGKFGRYRTNYPVRLQRVVLSVTVWLPGQFLQALAKTSSDPCRIECANYIHIRRSKFRHFTRRE